MKKLIVGVLVTLMLMLSFGCASEGVAQTDYDALKADYDKLKADYDALSAEHETLLAMLAVFDAAGSEPETSDDFDEEEVLSKLEVAEYSYSNDWWNYAFLVIKNNSDYNLELTAYAKFYNEAGELNGAKDTHVDAFENGTETILYFMPDEEYSRMEYTLEVAEESFYDCVVSDLTYESVKAEDKEIVSVTNSGEEAAEFVEGYALFFNGEEVVGFNSSYFTDDASELKPGKTITKELDCFEKYDSVKFFFTGYKY